MRAFVAIGLVLSGLLLAACDGVGEPSDIVYPDVHVAMEGDLAAFDTYVGVIRGIQRGGRGERLLRLELKSLEE